MSEHRDSRDGRVVQMAELRKRDEREPASAPSLPWSRPEAAARSRHTERMPNGDPPSVMLWGAEDV